MSYEDPTYKVKEKDDSFSTELYAPAAIIAALGIIAMLGPIFVAGTHGCPVGEHWDSDLGMCVPDE
jgi:hypothetical protein